MHKVTEKVLKEFFDGKWIPNSYKNALDYMANDNGFTENDMILDLSIPNESELTAFALYIRTADRRDFFVHHDNVMNKSRVEELEDDWMENCLDEMSYYEEKDITTKEKEEFALIVMRRRLMEKHDNHNEWLDSNRDLYGLTSRFINIVFWDTHYGTKSTTLFESDNTCDMDAFIADALFMKDIGSLRGFCCIYRPDCVSSR